MPLMTNPSRRQRHQAVVPRLRRRSLPRLRIGGRPLHSDLDDNDATVAKDLHENPKKARRRSYSLPRRLRRLPKDVDGREEMMSSNGTSQSTDVDVRQKKKVSFGDAVWEEKFDTPFDNRALSFDVTQVWYQESDYVRFQKDRILTSFDYQASVNGKSSFDHDTHAIRGLEMVIHERYSKKLKWEKKDLWRALQKEEAHQKQTGKFPNFERFKVVSQRYTKEAKNRANSLGAEDAKSVQGKNGKSWFARAFPERGVRRHRSMDSELL